MQAEIITIGDEILIGQILDSNSKWIAEELNKIEYVEYHLHSSFKNPVKRVRKIGGGFALSMKGWGTFNLKARVVFKDKNTNPLLLSHYLKFEPIPKTI